MTIFLSSDNVSKKQQMSKSILLSDNPSQENEYALFPLKYQWAWDSYKIMCSNLWFPEEISMSSDIQDWKTDKLTEEEQHMFLTVFAQLTTFDLLRTADIVQDFLPLVQAPEIVHVMTTQAFQECIHTQSYQTVIEALGLPQDDIYTRYKSVPQLSNRVALTERLGSLDKNTSIPDVFRALVHTYIMFEGVWFNLNLLGPVQSLARRSLMRGTAEQFQYISRDEQSHVALGIHLLRDFIAEHPEVMDSEVIEQVIEDTKEGLRLEDEFIDYALPRGIMGYNALDHKLTARHYTERWLARVGIVHDFEGEHKLPWIDEVVAMKKEKNFFETRVTEYQAGQNLNFSDDPSDPFASVM